jgi:hypothetical protein
MKGIIKYSKLELYLKKGGDPNAYSSEGESLLSIHQWYPRHAKLLLDNGADPNQSLYFNMLLSPISRACETDNIKFVKLLLNYNIKDFTMAFYYSRRSSEITRLFSEHGIVNKLYMIDFFNMFLRTYGISDIPQLKFRLKQQSVLSEEQRLFLQKRVPEVYAEFVRRKWLPIRCAVKFLGLHSRAVVTANHPLRKLERGEFKEE